MNLESIIFELGVIIVSAAFLGTLFLYAKQPIIIAYIAIGVLLGPNGFGVLKETGHIEEISHIGVILLLFIIGLNLQPARLLSLFRKMLLSTLITAFIFAIVSFLFALLAGLSMLSALVFGGAMMFSSTVVSLKLIPTTELHQQHTGEVMTSMLLIQDMIAILIILLITGEKSDHMLLAFLLLAGKFILLTFLAFAGVKYVMVPLFRKFDVIQEYTFLATLAWCFLWAEAAKLGGLSYELGAFVAGLSIASCSISMVIAEHLKPLREFFLILFFFAVGAQLDFRLEPEILILAVLFGILIIPFKFSVFKVIFKKSGETMEQSRELAARLGQSSEFSLLVAYSAVSVGVLSQSGAMMVQVATIVSFIISTYLVVLKYPTPISGDPKFRQD